MPVPTPFHRRTAALCTSYRWKEWAGYHAVCSYDTSIEPEYFAFRHAAGLLDVSPLFKYEIAGPDAAMFLTFVMTRDVTGLAPGRVTYACWCDDDGKVIDDGTVACLDEGRYRLTAASAALWWLAQRARGFDVEIIDCSESTAALALQGPNSRDVLQQIVDTDLAQMRYFGVARTRLAGATVDISRTGYTGDFGYEIWLDADDAVDIWDALIDVGEDFGLQPAGLDALDVTRLEAGFILHGVDYFSAPECLIDARKSSPFEIGLGWTVHLDREPFIGQAALQAEHERGAEWALVGLEIDWEELETLYDAHRLPPQLPTHAWRTPVPVFDGRTQVGQATSGTWSPTAKKNIALASVGARHAALGTKLRIEHTVEYRRRTITATVAERPFLDLPRKRQP